MFTTVQHRLVYLFMLFFLLPATLARAEVVIDEHDLAVFKAIIKEAGKELEYFRFHNNYEIVEGSYGYPLARLEGKRKNSVIELERDVLIDAQGHIIAFGLEKAQLKSTRLLNELKHLWAFGSYGSKIDEVDIRDLPALQYLSVKRGRIKKVKAIRNLPQLGYLNLANSGIPDLKHLEAVPKLEWLDISGNRLTSFRAIQNLNSLRKLYARGAGENLDSLEGIQGLTNLETAMFTGGAYKALTPLKALTKLKVLYLSFCESESLEAIAGLQSLEKLSSQECHLKDLKGLDQLRNLKKLNLKGNEIAQITDLSKMQSLEELNLAYNPITKIEGLDHNKNLKKIDCEGCPIEKISGLDGLASLESLILAYSNVSKIEGLDNLPGLKRLLLGGSDISKLENINYLQNLRSLSLDDTPLEKDPVQAAELRKLMRTIYSRP